jgi:hypothetical protein
VHVARPSSRQGPHQLRLHLSDSRPLQCALFRREGRKESSEYPATCYSCMPHQSDNIYLSTCLCGANYCQSARGVPTCRVVEDRSVFHICEIVQSSFHLLARHRFIFALVAVVRCGVASVQECVMNYLSLCSISVSYSMMYLYITMLGWPCVLLSIRRRSLPTC